MNLELLKLCINARECGKDANEIRLELLERKLSDPEIHLLLLESDHIHLQRLMPETTREKPSYFRYILYFLLLVFFIKVLTDAFLGYNYIGIMWLMLIWAIGRRLKFPRYIQEFRVRQH